MSDEKRPKTRFEKDQPQESNVNVNINGDKNASLLDRVGTSASGLLQSFSGRSAPATVSSDLASLHASTSKGESGSSSRNGGTFAPDQAPVANRAQDSGSTRSGDPEPFRTRPVHNASDAQETFDLWSRESLKLPGRDASFNDKFDDPIGRLSTRTKETSADTVSSSTGGRQEGHIIESDGAAIVSLLSQPDFDVDGLPSDIWNPTSQDQEPDIENNWMTDQRNLENVPSRSSAPFSHNNASLRTSSNGFDAEDVLAAQAMALESTPAIQGDLLDSNGLQILRKNERVNHYGLIPHFPESTHENTKIDMDDTQRDMVERIQRLISNPDEHLLPWLVLSEKYQDEVWGNLLPLVHEAREEIKEAKGNKDQPTENLPVGPAVRRLQMVLKHMSSSQG